MAEAVVLGSVELDHVTGVRVDESRKLSLHRWPGKDGDLVQDMGMAAASVRLTGVAIGDKAGSRLEQLRRMMHKGDPQDFTASAAVAADIDQVIVTGFRVFQPPGYVGYYEYELELLRYVATSTVAPGGFTASALSAIKSKVDTSALDKIKQTAGDLGKEAGRLQQLNDIMQETKDKLSLVKDGLKVFGGLDVLRKVISAGKTVVTVAKK